MAAASNGHLDLRRGPSPPDNKLRSCTFYHPPTTSSPQQNQAETLKKRFNVDSPSFTPSSSLAANGKTPPSKTSGLSPRAASAAPFKPKSLTPASSVASFSSTSGPKSYNPNAPDFVGAEPQEFLPQGFSNLSQVDNGSDYASNDVYGTPHDSTTAGTLGSVDSQEDNYQFVTGMHSAQPSSYMPTSNSTSQLLQHHLYAPLDSYARNIKPFQRTAKDVFIPEDLRLKLHKKTEATLRSFPNSQLPNLEYFHSLTPLELFSHRNSPPNSQLSTVFKAISDQDGKNYCLRRIHDSRMLRDSETALAVSSLKSKWSRILNSGIVTAHVAFSTQVFGDTSVIIVSDFFPDSITLRDKHSSSSIRAPNRGFSLQPSEQMLWSYIVQTANALKTIHSTGLAARMMDAKRWLVTDEDRLRFNACGLADILDPSSAPLHELQRTDLHNLGKLILTLGTTNAHNRMRPADHFARIYSPRLKSTVEWLQKQTLSPDAAGTVDDFLHIISTDTIDAFDASLRLGDTLQSTLNRELENSRLVRLLFKFNTITDRPEYDSEPTWRDQGQRAALTLFRDHVFHQVDGNGNPVIDMGHMLACMNKLDVGVEEKITLLARSEQTVVVISYRELKQAIDGAWGDLMRRSAV